MPKFNVSARRSYCVYRRGVQKQKKRQRITAQGFSSAGAFLSVCVVLVGVLYLFNANEVAIKGDEIYTIEQDIANLARDNEQLMIQNAQLRSLERVEDVIKDSDMEEITEPVYIERETLVALESDRNDGK